MRIVFSLLIIILFVPKLHSIEVSSLEAERRLKFNELFPKKICDKIYKDINFGSNNKLEEEIMVMAYHNLKRIKINETDSSLSLFFDNRTYSYNSKKLDLIKKNLVSLGIKHNSFVSEKAIVLNKEVESVISFLEDNSFVYKGKIKAPAGENNEDWVEREHLLFKSTDFGDDKDRALQKSDNSWTYFASDVAYHNHKIERQFDTLINILGADHAGYIKRITASVDALTGEQGKLICKVSQLVKLIKDGKLFKMSKRKGDYITVEDLISEVGKDATRFIMLSRTSDVELDFDFTKVKEKSKDNPLYYVQYCYARISSVFRNINKKINNSEKTKALYATLFVFLSILISLKKALHQFSDFTL